MVGLIEVGVQDLRVAVALLKGGLCVALMGCSELRIVVVKRQVCFAARPACWVPYTLCVYVCVCALCLHLVDATNVCVPVYSESHTEFLTQICTCRTNGDSTSTFGVGQL